MFVALAPTNLSTAANLFTHMHDPIAPNVSLLTDHNKTYSHMAG